jgi:hypothetical protein
MKGKSNGISTILVFTAALSLVVSAASTAFDWKEDIALKIGIADEKLEKIRVASEGGKIKPLEALINDYEIAIRDAADGVERADRNGKDVSGVAGRVDRKLKKNTEVLESLLTKVPPQARKGIQRAIENSKKHRGRAAKAKGLQKEHPGKGKAKAKGRGKSKGKRKR